jgi:type I restriction enzyme M protein
MQTNREDVGDRYREIMIPFPVNKNQSLELSKAFKEYFTRISESKKAFHDTLTQDRFLYLANVYQDSIMNEEEEIEETP